MNGAELRQQMLDSGAPPNEVAVWEHGMRTEMLQSGAPQEKISEFWGDPNPDWRKVSAHTQSGIASLSVDQKARAAQTPMEALQAGFQMSVPGLTTGKPTLTLAQDAGTMSKILYGAGMTVGDIPVSVMGFVGGATAGTAVAPGAGTVIGSLTGAAALPEALRQILMDQYANPDGSKTWMEVFERVANGSWETTKATAAGVGGGLVAGKVAAPVLKSTGSTAAATAVALPTMAASATAIHGALSGHVPDADDFITGAVLAIGFHASGALVGAVNKRFVPDKPVVNTSANLKDIYLRTGIPPWEVAQHVQGDPALLAEVLAPRTADGRLLTPGFDRLRKPEPQPFNPDAPEITAEATKPGPPPPIKEPAEVPVGKAPDDTYLITDPLGAKAEGETLQVRIIRDKEGKLEAFISDAGIVKVAPAYRDLSAEEAIAHTLGDHPMGAAPDVSKVRKATGADISEPAPIKPKPDPIATLEERLPAAKAALHPDEPLVTPETAAKYHFEPSRLSDPEYADHVARTVLADLDKRFQGNTTDVMVAFHMGPARARTWMAGGRDFYDLPVETQQFLQRAEIEGTVSRGFNDAQLGRQLESQGDPNWLSPPKGGPAMGDWVTSSDVRWKRWQEDKNPVVALDHEGNILGPAPELIADYLQEFGRRAGIKFMVGPPETVNPLSPEAWGLNQAGAFHQAVPGRSDRVSVVFIPDTPDALRRRWLGVGKNNTLFHEVGHALDFRLFNKHRDISTSLPAGPMRDEMIAASQRFRPSLWERDPTYNMTPPELYADAIASWLSNPHERKHLMPEFTKKYGKILQEYADIADGALPKRTPGGEWEYPPDPPEPPAGGGLPPGRVPPPGGGGGPPGGTPIPPGGGRRRGTKVESDRELTIDELRAAIDARIAPEMKHGIIPDWMNPWKLLAGFQSELVPARRIDRLLREEGTLKPGEVGVEDMLRQVYSSKETTGYFFYHGTIDPITRQRTSDNNIRAGYRAVKEDGGDAADFMRYRLAKRTLEKAEQGVDTGIDRDIATRFLAQKGMEEKYARGSEIISRTKDSIVDYVRDSGIFSSDQAAAMKDLNREHIVMRRQIEPDYVPAGYKGWGFRPGRPVKKMKGSDRLIIDPNTTEIDNAHTMIAMADRNRAVGNIIGAIEAHNARLPLRLEDPAHIPFYNVTEEFGAPTGRAGRGTLHDEHGRAIPEHLYDGATPFLALRMINGRLGPKDFPFFRDGKLEVWRATNEDVAKVMRVAITQQDEAIANLAIRFASLERAGISSTPSFVFRSLHIGQLAKAVFGEGVSRIPYHGLGRGIAEVWKRGPEWDEWVRNGGAGSALSDMDVRYFERDKAAVFESTGAMAAVWNVVKHPLDALRQLQSAADAASRVGDFITAKQKGADPFKAAMLARKSQLDYAENLTSAMVTKWVRSAPFATTGVKSIEQMAQAFRDRPGTTLAMAYAVYSAPTILNYALNHLADQGLPDKDKYTSLPRWMRDTYWNLPPVGGVRVRIPRGVDPAAMIFGAGFERFMDTMFEKDPAAFKKWADDIILKSLPTLTPAILVPGIEHFANRELYTGKPLVKASLEKASGYMQYTIDTTETAKKLTQLLGPAGMNMLDASPIVVDNYVKKIVGTAPMDILKVLEMPFKDVKRPLQAADIPFVGAFLVRNPGAGKFIDDFYDGLKKVEAAHVDLRLALERQDFSQIKDHIKLETAISLSKHQEALRISNQLLNLIYRNKELTDDEKRKRIDSIYSSMAATAKNGNMVIRSLDRPPVQ